MEIPDLGKQCSIPTCNTLDFLPLQCSCGVYFCKNHFPVHITDCSVLKRDFQIFETQQSTKSALKCSVDNCKEISLIGLECLKCKKYFCVVHRYHSVCYDLSNASNICKSENNKQLQEAQQIIDKKVETQLANAMKKPALIKTANKVQLMRLKGRAKGENNIPHDDRVYFTAYFKNKNGVIEQFPVYISKTWSVGRSIDSIAKLCNISNRNNQTDSLKLRFFRKDTCEILETLMSKTVDELINESIIINGDNIIIDYCDNSNQSINSKIFLNL